MAKKLNRRVMPLARGGDRKSSKYREKNQINLKSNEPDPIDFSIDFSTC
jgi:hypothetical protein